MRRRAAWLGLVILAGLLGLGAFPRSGLFGGAPKLKVPTFQVAREPFVHRVAAEGNLRASRATPVNVPMGGNAGMTAFRIAWLAPDGMRVKGGDVVARFDPTELQKTLTEAEGSLASARLKEEKERVSGQAELGKLSRDAAIAKVELDNARRFQAKDTMIFSRHQIIESDIDQTLAAERQRHAEEQRGTRETLGKTGLDLIAIEQRQAEQKIDLTRKNLGALTVTAPHDGVLVLERDYRGNAPHLGDSVWSGQPLAVIPDLARMEADVYVLEADAGGLAAGKTAAVSVESAPGRTFPATIQRVESLAKPRFRGSPVQYFGVTLRFDSTDPQVMKPGQRVQASLLLDERKGALAVPRQAVFDQEGKPIVYRLKGSADGGAFEPVPVVLGPSGMGRVVIESGISAGDVLALADPNRRPDDPKEKKAPGAPTGPSTPSTMAPAL